MTPDEHVQELDLDVTWNGDAPCAVLVSSDVGRTALQLRPGLNDPDRRDIILAWESCASATMGPPNDEALLSHRLYGKGLEDVVWMGEVMNSRYVIRLETMNSGHPHHDPGRYEGLRHFILPLKECTVEVVADGLPHVLRHAST